LSKTAWHRLDRDIPGQRQHLVGPVAGRAGERLEREGLDTREVWEPSVRTRSGGTRKSNSRVQAGPYAPQLIRLVRTPYVLSTAWARRQSYRDPLEVGGRAKPDAGQQIRDALAERPTPSVPRVERVRPSLPPRRAWQLRGDE
jgi:hypothetical protein